MLDVQLGGRLFTPINFHRRTVLIDHYLLRLIRETGLDAVKPDEDEAPEVWQARLQTQLLCSGRAHELIAGYLLPLGKTEADWTPELAAETAAHIARCDTAEDREVVKTLALEATIAFFADGLASVRIFLSSLQGLGVSPQESSTAGRSSWASGLRSCAKWLATTTRAQWRSAVGHSTRS